MDLNRIIDSISVDDETGCWNWKRSLSSSGYGQLSEGGVYWSSHRYSYTFFNGNISKGMVIRHLCHNRKCCNAEHLRIGSQCDNYADSIDVYKESSGRMRKKYIIGSNEYNTFRSAQKGTGLSNGSISKYTDKETRIFNIEAYKNGCFKARVKPIDIL